MQKGDLVKMTRMSFWQKKNPKASIAYTEMPLLVYETAENAIKVIMPDGTVKTDLAEYYEVVSESR